MAFDNESLSGKKFYECFRRMYGRAVERSLGAPDGLCCSIRFRAEAHVLWMEKMYDYVCRSLCVALGSLVRDFFYSKVSVRSVGVVGK